jgi:alpha-D-ribose 1-methylphosphonate 5-triphosphate synthase subunit PhnH
MNVPLALGFAEPVLDAQRVFRAVMEALARPGTVQALACPLAPPAPLTPELAAVALTLVDHETPLWLDEGLRAAPGVAEYLRFHAGAPIVETPASAAFALVADPLRMPPFEAFAPGTPDYPDRSTTLILSLERLSPGPGFTLQGPGIESHAELDAAPLPPDFVTRWAANRADFPLGLDLILTSRGRVAGLPRSTAISEG